MFVILPYFLEGVDQRGVSQKEFATLLGVSQGTLLCGKVAHMTFRRRKFILS